MTGLPGQCCQKWTGRTGLSEQEGQDRAARTGPHARNCSDKAARALQKGLSEQYSVSNHYIGVNFIFC
jgi:hypothetical protein